MTSPSTTGTSANDTACDKRPSDTRGHDLSTLRRGLEILDALRQSAWYEGGAGWGNQRIADYLGADKSQVSRTLKVLVELGLVVRDDASRTYRLGTAAYSIGMRAADQQLLRRGSVVVRKAMRSTGTRVFLVVRQGSSAVTLWSDAPPHVRPIVDSIGMTYPVVSTETGRSLLYGNSPDEIREILAEVNDRTKVEECIACVARDRQQGHSWGTVADQSAGCLAVPVWTSGRKVAASLGAASPALVDPKNVTSTVRILLAAAADLTRQLTEELRADVAVNSVPYEGWPAGPNLSTAR